MYSVDTFVAEYRDETSESQQGQNFVRDFVRIFTDEDPKSVFRFEYPVYSGKKYVGEIDGLWEGHILIEMKSAGKNLEDALENQVRKKYIANLTGNMQPKMIVVSDFQRFLVVDPDGREHRFALTDLPTHMSLFYSMFDGLGNYLRTNGTVDERAAKLLANVVRQLGDAGYDKDLLPEYATRLLFCLYADDNGVWDRSAFHREVLESREDGSNLGRKVHGIFDLLNRPDANGTEFRYINGGVFHESIPVATYDAKIRRSLLDACEYDWCGLDPMIFGKIYESVLDFAEQHADGVHYTHESDIRDILGPAKYDELERQYERVKSDPQKLEMFIGYLSTIQVMDPACGSGNFLLVAYRDLRKLETKAIAELARLVGGQAPYPRVSLAQFHGIELKPLAASVAKTSLWLALHAADQEHGSVVGSSFSSTFPLHQESDIRVGNAATADWVEMFPKMDLIVGNPPYVSAKKERDGGQSAQQRQERKSLGISGGMMDYAHIWLVKGAQYVGAFTDTKVAYVITDSVVQGTQAKGLWSHEAMQSVYVQFGRQSYIWPGDAQVRVVNIGLGVKPEAVELKTEDSEVIDCDYITPYLKPSTVPTRTTQSTSRVSKSWMVPWKNGVSYADFGHYSQLGEDLVAIQRDHPEMLVNKVSARNALSGKPDPVLWFGNRSVASVKHRVISRRREAVRVQRGDGHAKSPEWLPPVVTGDYMLIPRTFSKSYVCTPVVVVSGENYMTDKVYYAPLDWFSAGLVMSRKAKDAIDAGASRMGKGGDVQYSTGVLYGMSDPKNDTPELREKIAAKAKECIEARPGPASDCMKVSNMPSELARLHRELDVLVEKWWG